MYVDGRTCNNGLRNYSSKYHSYARMILSTVFRANRLTVASTPLVFAVTNIDISSLKIVFWNDAVNATTVPVLYCPAGEKRGDIQIEAGATRTDTTSINSITSEQSR